MLLASVTGSLTSYVRDHGVYAVFLLMMIDAVLPAFSELVMVVGGALAAGAFGATRDPLRARRFRRASGRT